MHVADSRRVLARMEFLRALAAHSDAIADLHRRRNESDRGVCWLECPGGDEAALVSIYGARRVAEAKAWAARFKLSVPWLHAWATYALHRWDVGPTCRDPQCRHRRRRPWPPIGADYTPEQPGSSPRRDSAPRDRFVHANG